MKRRLTILAIAIPAMVALITSSVAAVAAQNEEITYEWLACGGILEDGPSCPNTTFASNGDSIKITGAGELTDGTNSASGGGTFVHKDADGNVVGAGTWVATELLNFKTYGPSPVTDADWRTGLARIRVDLMVGGVEVAEGILSIGCRLPGVKLPPSLFEGVKLNIQDGLNFNKVQTEGEMPPGGVTLFIEQ